MLKVSSTAYLIVSWGLRKFDLAAWPSLVKGGGACKYARPLAVLTHLWFGLSRPRLDSTQPSQPGYSNKRDAATAPKPPSQSQ